MNSQFSKKRNRAIVFWIFTSLAFPLGAVVIGYASGYRFQPQTSSLIQTSALRIISKPKRAVVYLNGKTQEQRTPYLEDTITPGVFTVKLEKEEHVSWEKQLRFEAGKSHVFGNILLFRLSTPVVTNTPDRVSARSEFHELSTEQRALLGAQRVTHVDYFEILEGPDVLVRDTTHVTTFLLPHLGAWEERKTLDGAIVNAEWSNNRLLMATSHELWMYHHKEKVTELLSRQGDRIIDARWHPEGYYVLYSTDHEIIAMELDNRDERQRWVLATIPQATQLTFSKNGDHLFFTSQGKWFDLRLY